MRAALAATASFAWIFVLQYFYALYGTLIEAFLRTILLYVLSQTVSVLLTPYSAMQLVHGVRSRIVAGAFVCFLALVTLAATLMGLGAGIVGLLAFAIFFGAYRAIYWTPYVLEKGTSLERSGVTQELFIALMPAIAGLTLVDGQWGATALLFAGATIIFASLGPLASVPEMHERFVWGYRQTFSELFESKYNALVEPAFLQGLQGTALYLLWPMAIFVIVGLSYTSLGLVLTATLLIAALLRPYGSKYLERKVYLHAMLAATSWFLRLIVATPLGVVLVDGYSSGAKRPGEYLTLEQAADNGTYIDEYTVLKEISMILGRLFMCGVAGVSIVAFGLPVGLAVAFALAAAAAAIQIIHAHRTRESLA
jgi:hypothetical protein